MADVAGRPILELLLHQLHRHGFERAILAVGYGKEAIQAHFGDRACGLRVAYSVESDPLGTGGALGNAAALIETDDVLIMNGDSYTDTNLTQFAAEHSASGAEVSVVVVPIDARVDCGTVSVDSSGQLTGFWEKQGAVDARYVNAGIYMASRRILASIPHRQVSLERELFPQWLGEGRNIRAFVWQAACIDIGTPERFESAQRLLENAESVTSRQDQI
jgi:NDP-sugar pyrophosphorylase family protein